MRRPFDVESGARRAGTRLVCQFAMLVFSDDAGGFSEAGDTKAGVTGDGIAWQANIRAPASAASAATSTPDFQGFWVTVTVRWKEGPRRPEQSLQLQTFKLRRGP